jgi:hypothetical protein
MKDSRSGKLFGNGKKIIFIPTSALFPPGGGGKRDELFAGSHA